MKIGIFYDREPNESGYLQQSPRYWPYWRELQLAANQLGHDFYVVCLNTNYQGNGVFGDYWKINEHPIGTFTRVEQPITLDLVFDKGYFTANDGAVKAVNSNDFMQFVRSKDNQLKVYKDEMPVSQLVESQDDLVAAYGVCGSNSVIVKPLSLNGGIGIITADSIEQLEQAEITYPAIMQELIDASGGYPGIAKGVHDIRVYMLGDKPELISVRTPPEGSLIANTKQGGSIEFFEIDAIDDQLKQYAAKIDAMLPVRDRRFYSIDVMYANERFYLVEVTERPGLPIQSQAPFIKDFQLKLMDYISS